MVDRKSFIKQLADAQDVKAHYAFIDGCANSGEIETLKELLTQLNDRKLLSPSKWAPLAVLERIMETLALTEGYNSASTALEFACAIAKNDSTNSPRVRPAAVASKIVAAQPRSVIDAVMNAPPDLEAAALILHEAVIRKKLGPDLSSARSISERLASAKHPLAVLPLSLLDFETDAPLPSYEIDSSGYSMPYGLWGKEPISSSTGTAKDLVMTETTCPNRANRMCAAVQNWIDESNGQAEARIFTVDDLEVSQSAALIPNLALDCVRSGDKIHWQNSDMKEVYSVLFSAAANGGAYNDGEFGAYGRLRAWNSLAGIIGCSSTSTIAEVGCRALECHWSMFKSSSEWYYQIAWDIGIACANPARNELAVLAATDID